MKCNRSTDTSARSGLCGQIPKAKFAVSLSKMTSVTHSKRTMKAKSILNF